MMWSPNYASDGDCSGAPSLSRNAATLQRFYANSSGLGSTSTSTGRGSPSLSRAGWPPLFLLVDQVAKLERVLDPARNGAFV